MHKSHYFILASFVSVFYWLLDAYTNASLYDTSFINEVLLQTPHSIVFMKFFTALLLFALSLIPLVLKQKSTAHSVEPPLNEFTELQRMADILFSSLSTKINTIKSLEIFEEALHLEAAILFIYDKETFSLYNENDFIKSAFRSKEITPLRANPNRSEIEEIAISCYVEKRPASKDTIKWGHKHLTLFSFELKEDRSEKALGSLMIATYAPQTIETHKSLIQRYLQMLTFVLSLAIKKELLQGLNVQYSSESSSYDKILDIMNYSKMQEHIEHEFKRHKRYHTPLTLVLIEINLFKNISNIFPTDVITTLKKDFIQLMKKNTRDVDIFAKWNTDQYALLLPNVDFRAGQGVAKKLQAILAETKFARIGNLSCNFGITSLVPKDTIATFRARAESALVVAASRESNNAIEVKLHAEH